MTDDSDAVNRMHVDLASRFEHDKRIRALEIGQASTDARLAAPAAKGHSIGVSAVVSHRNGDCPGP